jgi:hypothetical protein
LQQGGNKECWKQQSAQLSMTIELRGPSHVLGNHLDGSAIEEWFGFLSG